MHIHIHIHHHDDRRDEKIFEQIHLLNNKIDIFMEDATGKYQQLSDTLDQLNAKADTQALVQAALKGSVEGIKGDFGVLTQEIADLKATVANGGAVSLDQLDALLGKATTLGSKLDATASQLGEIAKEASDLDAETPPAVTTTQTSDTPAV